MTAGGAEVTWHEAYLSTYHVGRNDNRSFLVGNSGGLTPSHSARQREAFVRHPEMDAKNKPSKAHKEIFTHPARHLRLAAALLRVFPREKKSCHVGSFALGTFVYA